MSIITPPQVFQPLYPQFSDKLKTIIATNNGVLMNSLFRKSSAYDISMLKGKCLECFALMGKAVGIQAFYQDSIIIISQIIAIHEQVS